MNWKIPAFISILFLMLATSASACHYWCGPNTGLDPAITPPDVSAYPGQTLTFTGDDPLATYAFVVHDEMGWNHMNPTPMGGSPFTWTVPMWPCSQTHYYTVTWTATRAFGDLKCIKEGCIKIKVHGDCPDCPRIPDYCEGHSGFTSSPLSVTLPYWMTVLGAECYWYIDGATTPEVGNPPLWNGWDTLAVGEHTIVLEIKIGNVVVFRCTITFNVRPYPVGGISIAG